jgi:hypothetical protein
LTNQSIPQKQTTATSISSVAAKISSGNVIGVTGSISKMPANIGKGLSAKNAQIEPHIPLSVPQISEQHVVGALIVDLVKEKGLSVEMLGAIANTSPTELINQINEVGQDNFITICLDSNKDDEENTRDVITSKINALVLKAKEVRASSPSAVSSAGASAPSGHLPLLVPQSSEQDDLVGTLINALIQENTLSSEVFGDLAHTSPTELMNYIDEMHRDNFIAAYLESNKNKPEYNEQDATDVITSEINALELNVRSMPDNLPSAVSTVAAVAAVSAVSAVSPVGSSGQKTRHSERGL